VRHFCGLATEGSGVTLLQVGVIRPSELVSEAVPSVQNLAPTLPIYWEAQGDQPLVLTDRRPGVFNGRVVSFSEYRVYLGNVAEVVG
jgi:hypothetical protein